MLKLEAQIVEFEMLKGEKTSSSPARVATRGAGDYAAVEQRQGGWGQRGAGSSSGERKDLGTEEARILGGSKVCGCLYEF